MLLCIYTGIIVKRNDKLQDEAFSFGRPIYFPHTCTQRHLQHWLTNCPSLTCFASCDSSLPPPSCASFEIISLPTCSSFCVLPPLPYLKKKALLLPEELYGLTLWNVKQHLPTSKPPGQTIGLASFPTLDVTCREAPVAKSPLKVFNRRRCPQENGQDKRGALQKERGVY